MAKIISINGATAELAIPFTWEETATAVAQTPIINPCIKCEYKGLCSDDDCGKKLYPLDVPSTRFKNLEEYIQFMKHQGWL